MSDMHPTGEYPATILDHGFSTARSGTRQLWVVFETLHGKLTTYLALTAAASEFTAKKVRAMGFMEDDFELLADGERLKGLECVVTVTHETYNEQTRAKVGWIYPPGGGGMQRDPEAAKDSKRFNAALKKEPKVGEAPAAEASTAEEPAVEDSDLGVRDDEVPF